MYVMALEENDRADRFQPSQELLELPPDRAVARRESEAKSPAAREFLRDRTDGSDVLLPDAKGEWKHRGDKRGRDHARRYTFAVPIGILLAAPVASGGYLYWDYASHFETTDDAFIAARQFAIAPQVSGNITSVPVTDNEHVPAGGVIA